MNAAWVTLTVDGSEMETYLALPDDPGPAPGVVVAHYAGGVDAFIRGIVERFAGDGLAAICPNLFHRAPESDEPRITRMTNPPVAQVPRAMAAALVGMDEVDSVSVGPEDGELIALSRNVNALQLSIPRLAQELGIRLMRVEPLDESLESIFSYVVER